MRKHQTREADPSTRVVKGSGNVFEDMGFSRSEAAESQVKAELTRLIHNRIRLLGLTQVQAAQRLKLGQPDVSKLMNARFTGFSTDRLIALLSALEVDVDIVIRPRKGARRHEHGIVRVREAEAA